MEPSVNPGKELTVQIEGKTYERYALKTHFVTIGENLVELAKEYAQPNWKPGDVLSISEKVVALCQKRVVYRDQIHPGFWAKLLYRFVGVTPAGPGAGTAHKMQLIIMQCGLWRVLLAALCSALTKPFGKKGVFYRVCGNDVGGIDGLIDYDISFPEYVHYAILSPLYPDEVCRAVEAETGMPCIIIDACDLDVQILGKSEGVKQSNALLHGILADNPAGQDDEQTPLLLLREIWP